MPLDRVSLVVTSEIMAIDICTLPSVSPPTMRDSRNTEKDDENIHSSIESALPICASVI